MKKWLALCLTICLVVMLHPATNQKVNAATIAEQHQSQPIKDLTEHWAESAVEHMVALGLMNGYVDGRFKPDVNITRAEFVTVLDRAFGFTGRHSDVFKDMHPSAWYYDGMMRAYGSGIVLGTSQDQLSPADPVTREDAAVMIDRAFQLSTELESDDVLKKYDDYSTISKYAKKAISYLVRHNMMKGYNGSLQPQAPITRAETAMLLSAMTAVVIRSSGVYEEASGVEGNVIIRAADASLRNTVINGNLLLAEGIGNGTITLEGVNVSGSVIIKGRSSVDIRNSNIHRIMIDNKQEPVNMTFNQTSEVEELSLLQQAIVKLSHDSSIEKLHIDSEAHGAVVQAEGSIKKLTVEANQVMINDEEVRAGLQISIPAKEQGDNQDIHEDTVSPSNPSKPNRDKPVPTTTIPDHQWKLVWNDEFNGSDIDPAKWTVMDTGLVYNNELQYYSPNNTRIIKDGNRSVLQIEAKRGGDGGKEYSSGKLITMGKGDWTYGKVVVRAKLPVQQGIWPAIWMMPTDEAHYGGWPASGEIDIMELIGGEQNKNRVYSTLHFDSKQPDGSHGHVQGSYTLPEGQSFSDDYHDFQVEWLPGLIRFYMDGKLHHEVKDWQTKASGQPEYYTYPAPFDRPFYLILNVAVGGDWPGSPNDDFQSDTMEVDFVRVYSYNDLNNWPDVTGNPPKPEKLREPQEDGNQLYNANFTESTAAEGVPSQWQFLTNANGVGTIEVVDDELKGKAAKVSINDAGSESYSIQLTQMPIYVEKHKRYKVTFDAKASAERTLMSKVTQYENNWTNYSGDQYFELTTDWQSYEYSFNMNTSSDNNARFEFNLGLNDESVMLANVRLIELGDAEPFPELPGERPTLSDGNYIYNGTFDQGKDRLAFWNTDISSEAVAKVSVNNFLQFPIMERQLTVEVSETNGDPKAVVVAQPELFLEANTTYGLYYDAKAREPRSLAIHANHSGDLPIHIAQDKDVQLGTEMQSYTAEIVVGDAGDDGKAEGASALEFLFGESTGTVYIDNVRLVKRGQPVLVDGYAHVPAAQAWLMQGLQLEDSSEGGKNVAYMNEGDLLQYKVQVARDAYYALSARLASNEDHAMVGVTVKDDEGQIVSSSELNLGSTGGWQTYQTVDFAPVALEVGRSYYVEFTGVDYNTLWIDLSENKVRDGEFSAELSYWSLIPADLKATRSELGDFTITLPGTTVNWWDALLQQDQLSLEAGKLYRLEFNAYTSDDQKTLQIVLSENGGEFTKYFEEEVQLSQDKQNFAFMIAMGTRFDPNAVLAFGLGNAADGAHTVSINQIRLYEINPKEGQDGQPINVNLITNGDFSNGSAGWTTYAAGDQSQLNISTIDHKLQAIIGHAGDNPWDRQVIYEGIAIQQGSQYTISFKAKADNDRKLGIGIGWVDAENNYEWHGFFEQQVELTSEEQVYTYTFEAKKDSYAHARISFDMGNMLGEHDSNTSITLSDVSLVHTGPAH